MAAKRVFEGLTVVTAGVILLANTTGVLPWTVWWTILGLWPLLLVSAGIDILGHALNSTALRVLSSLVVIAGLVFGALAGAGQVQAPAFWYPAQQARGEAFSYREPYADVDTGRAHVSAGAARVTIEAGSGLAGAKGRSPFGKPTFSAKTSEGSALVDIGSADGSWVGAPGRGSRSFLDVTLGRGVLWENVKVDAGAADLRLDLSGLRVRRFEADLGMSSAQITMGSLEPEADVTLDGGMAALKLRVPRESGVEVRVDNGLGSVNMRGEGWERTSGDGPFQGTWRTEGYETASSRLRVTVKVGLSSVDVERY